MDIKIPDEYYRAPRDLLVTPTQLKRVMIVGSCLLAGWPEVIENSDPGCPCDFFLTNNVGNCLLSLLEQPASMTSRSCRSLCAVSYLRVPTFACPIAM